MIRLLAKFLLKIAGWSVNQNLPKESDRCVMIASPHTSNWDFYFMRVAFYVLGIPMKVTIKKSWTVFPLNLFISPMGGLGIDRSPKEVGGERVSYVDAMAALIKENKKIAMIVTPEGTRSLRTSWKKGFYYTAIKAEVPITFGYLDYVKKEAGVGGVLYPTGDYDKDMRVIANFYKNINACYPEKFSVDQQYIDV